MTVVADREAVAFIAEHGGHLYLWADKADLKQVHTSPPDDPSITFEEMPADGFIFYVANDIEKPDTWNVKFRHLPWPHVDVLWDGRQPGPGFGRPDVPLWTP